MSDIYPHVENILLWKPTSNLICAIQNKKPGADPGHYWLCKLKKTSVIRTDLLVIESNLENNQVIRCNNHK